MKLILCLILFLEVGTTSTGESNISVTIAPSVQVVPAPSGTPEVKTNVADYTLEIKTLKNGTKVYIVTPK